MISASSIIVKEDLPFISKCLLLNDEKTFDLPKMYFPFTPYNRILGPKEEPIEDFP